MVWTGAALYAGVLVLAWARDITRSRYVKMRREPKRIFSPHLWYESITRTYRDTRGFFYIELFRLLSNLVVCTVYVYSTYRHSVPIYIATINRVFGALFVLDIILGSIFSGSAVLYFFTFARFLQIFSLPSLFIAEGNNTFLHFGYLRAFSAYDSYIRMERRMVQLPFAPKKFAFRLFFQFLTLFYVLAAGIQMLEIPGDWLNAAFTNRWAAFNDWTFFNCLYYVIVTLSTVGYGDLSPKTIQGRVYTIFMIVIGIIVFTNIIEDLKQDTKRQRGDGSYRPRRESRHVIVSGTPTLDDLVHFVAEFYADNRHLSSNTVIVVLIENPKWEDDKWYRQVARNHFLQNHVIYLVGSVQEPRDLERAGIAYADAVFILTSPAFGEEPSEQDTQTVMSALAIRNGRTDIPIFSQTLLDDSNEQIRFAMKTPAFMVGNKALLYRGEMGEASKYRGLYETVMLQEQEFLPEFLKNSSSASSDAAAKADDGAEKQDKEKFSGIRPSEADVDLKRSSNVCLQQLYTALLVANIKANGVGTLCTNLYFEFGLTDNQTKNQPPWLSEYHLGAESTLLHAMIPTQLDGVRIADISGLLFRRGIIVVGTRAKEDLEISTVISPTKKLVGGEIGVFLTYLRIEHLALTLHLVAHERSVNVPGKTDVVLCEKFKLAREKPPAVNRRSRRRSSVSALPDFAAQPTGGRLSNHKRSVTFGSFDDVNGSDSTYDTLFFDSQSHALRNSPSHTDFIGSLSQHVILAMDGRETMENLPYFLKLLWHNDLRPDEKQALVPVVIIHPSLNEEDRRRYRQHLGKWLFFIDGKPAARTSWEEANLKSARAVATMANYTQEWRRSDARTLYTLLALDALTTPDQNLFICSELINERSLELLREPSHVRRRGARLGKPLRRGLYAGQFSSVDEDDDDAKKGGGDDGDLENEEGTLAFIGEEQWGSERSSDVSNPEEVCATNALFNGPKGPGDDSTERPGITRTKRDFLFSRYRYTSGELLVHSTSDSLLVREYTEPGFVKFITSLCGASTSAPGQKIRLVSIPRSLFKEYEPMDGKKFVEYGIVFERLIALGVTPLGLYRSGEAPVRMPKEKRMKRGTTIYRQLALANTPATLKSATRRTGGFRPIQPIQNLMQHGQDALPGRVLSRRGERELVGAVAVGTSQDEDDEQRRQVRNLSIGRRSQTTGPIPATESTQSARLAEDDYAYETKPIPGNLLPYVYTLPDPATLVAETDGVYVLCDPTFALPRDWPRPGLTPADGRRVHRSELATGDSNGAPPEISRTLPPPFPTSLFS